MKIYTSYFANIHNLPSNFLLFSISGKTPEWFHGERIPELAPKYAWWKEWKEKFSNDLESRESIDFYIAKYRETVLSKIGFSWLNGKFPFQDRIPCLLCYERPDRFCHRHVVAKYLNENGIETEEYIKWKTYL